MTSKAPEDKIFDKAVKAASLEELKVDLEKTRADIKKTQSTLKESGEEDTNSLESRLESLEAREKWFLQLIEAQKKRED